jgi:hypothetical protein
MHGRRRTTQARVTALRLAPDADRAHVQLRPQLLREVDRRLRLQIHTRHPHVSTAHGGSVGG